MDGESTVESAGGPRGDVLVVGLGYVGIGLAVTLADVGYRVYGVERNASVAERLSRGEPHLLEPGLAARLQDLLPYRLIVGTEFPDVLPGTVVVCVGTPVDVNTGTSDLRQLDSVARALAERMGENTLVVLRSTVPIGTTRNFVGSILSSRVREPLLAFCPERTIQGAAIEELRSLPQIVSGVSETAKTRAAELFAAISPEVVPVSSLEAAETIKLICNAHTDLIYGFGNEVAFIAEALGLDADELIRSANLKYPRPDLSRPGFVGGSCLIKDPYHLVYSSQAAGYTPEMVLSARRLNESAPVRATTRVLDSLCQHGRDLARAKVLLCGIAYKGRPETDDTRGTPAELVAGALAGKVGRVVGHDFVVTPEQISRLGIEPSSLEEGFDGADAVMVLIDHPGYGEIDLDSLLPTMVQPPVIYDAWGMLAPRLAGSNGTSASGLTYMKLGRG